jgi:hypothetical protein
MRRIRFSIASLLVVVLVLGMSFAALRESNEIWDSAVLTLTLVILLTSVLLAIHRTGSRRAFWMGFALFGVAYLGLSLVPSVASRLLTTRALAYLDSRAPGRSLGFFTFHTGPGAPGNQVQSVAFTVDGRRLATSSPVQVRLWDTTKNFVRIGHSLIALLAGWFGGLLSHRLWRASRSRQESTAVDAQGTDP